jgi:hypothetical protein
MSDIAIRVENLSKQYRIGGPQARYKTIRESLTEAVGAPFRRLSSSSATRSEGGGGHRCTQIGTDKKTKKEICVSLC